jgi:hypothetical protein
MSGYLQSRDVRFPLSSHQGRGFGEAARCGPPLRSAKQPARLAQGRERLRELRFGALVLSLLDELHRLGEPLAVDDFCRLHAVLFR